MQLSSRVYGVTVPMYGTLFYRVLFSRTFRYSSILCTHYSVRQQDRLGCSGFGPCACQHAQVSRRNKHCLSASGAEVAGRRACPETRERGPRSCHTVCTEVGAHPRAALLPTSLHGPTPATFFPKILPRRPPAVSPLGVPAAPARLASSALTECLCMLPAGCGCPQIAT